MMKLLIINKLINSRLFPFILKLIVIVYFLLIPHLNHKIYIDENALQPNNLNPLYNNNLVRLSDTYSDTLQHSQLHQYHQFIQNTLQSNALEPFYHSPSNSSYTLLKSPRSSNSESIIIHSPIMSSIDSIYTLKYSNNQPINVRGISTILSLSRFFNNQSIWSKDILFVFTDHLDVFLDHYMNGNITTIPKNNIWLGYSLDYSSDSFDHLSIQYQAPSILPNFDVIATLYSISNHQSVHIQSSTLIDTIKYAIFHHSNSSHHSSMLSYKIDAISIKCNPSHGPHGFLSLGRILEAYTRSFNNLIERLHASLAFYLFFDNKLIKLTHYIPLIAIPCFINLIDAFKPFKISKTDIVTIPAIIYSVNLLPINNQLLILLSTLLLRAFTTRTTFKLSSTLVVIYTTLFNFYVSAFVALISAFV